MSLVRCSNVETGVAQTILTWSHTYCLCHTNCLSCLFFTLFAKQNKVNKQWNNSLRKQTVSFSRWLPLLYTTITVIVPAISWICMYSVVCYMCSCFNHNRLCLEWINSLSVPSFCAFFCFLPLPLLFGHPLIRFDCLCSCQPYMGKCPSLLLSLSFFVYVFFSVIIDIPFTFHTKRSRKVIISFTCTVHSWPGAMKYYRLNRSRDNKPFLCT